VHDDDLDLIDTVAELRDAHGVNASYNQLYKACLDGMVPELACAGAGGCAGRPPPDRRHPRPQSPAGQGEAFGANPGRRLRPAVTILQKRERAGVWCADPSDRVNGSASHGAANPNQPRQGKVQCAI
jgi:hypothetical protein